MSAFWLPKILKSAVGLLTMRSNSLEENPHLVDDQKDGQLKEWRFLLDLGDRISIYQPEQDGLTFPELPVFETLNKSVNIEKNGLLQLAGHLLLRGLIMALPGI